MLPLGEEIFKYDVDQPLFFINTQAFHRWKENMEPLKNFINKKPGKHSYLETSYYCAFHKHTNSEAAVNHLNGPLRKQTFTLMGSKGHGL